MNTELVKVKPKSRFSNFRLFQTSLLYQTREFFNNSTLHGVRYIAETGRPFGERYEKYVVTCRQTFGTIGNSSFVYSFRFMWFCFTGTGTVAALIIIVSLWEKFQTNPTITGIIHFYDK